MMAGRSKGWLPTLVICLMLLPVCCQSELAPKEMKALFDEGNELFRRANESVETGQDEARALYGKAAIRFERIVEEGGVRNGKLYYNIGNAYFRMEDIGRAILNYRRAQLYMPNDANLIQNLKYARARRGDRIEEPQKKLVLKTLFFWHYDIPARIRAVIFAVSFVCAWGFALLRLFVRRHATAWAVSLSAVVAVLLFVSLAADTLSLSSRRPGVIVSREVIARKGDSDTYERSFEKPLHAGTEFELLEDRGTWYQIELGDSRRCWVPVGGVELIQPGQTQTRRIES